MKKFFRGATAFVLGATLSMALASCHKGDAELESTVTEKLNENDAPSTLSKTLVVKSNVAATFVYEGVSQGPAMEGKFEKAKASGKLVVTPTDKAYLPQTVDVAFGEEDWKQVNVQLYKQSTEASYQTPGQELKVKNDQANQDENQLAEEESGTASAVTAELTVPADAGNTGNTDDPYSITVFTPATGETQGVISANQTISDAVLGLDCRPDGAVFTNPVTVDLVVPGSDYLNLKVTSRENKSEAIKVTRKGNNALSVSLKHFSIYDIMMLADVISVNNEESVIFDQTIDVAAGRQQVSYTRKLGYDADFTAKTLIGKFLDNTFGVPMFEQNSQYSFNVPTAGQAHVKLVQKVTTFVFESKREDDPSKFTRFNVVVYGKVTPSVELTHPASSEIKTHSGGSGD